MGDKSLQLIFWKNLWLQWHYRSELLFATLSPSIYLLILLLLRIWIKADTYTAMKFKHEDLQLAWAGAMDELATREKIMRMADSNFSHNVFVPKRTICYAPNYPGFTEIMEKVERSLKIKSKVYKKCSQLERAIQRDNFFAGVCFDDAIVRGQVDTEILHMIGNLPNRLNFTLITPSELRFFNSTFISDKWNFDEVVKNIYMLREHTYVLSKSYGNVYIREGLVYMQWFISLAYIKLVTNGTNLPKVRLASFPQSRRDYDRFADTADIEFSFVLVTGQIFTMIVYLKLIMHEREAGLLKLMKLHAVSCCTHFCAWLLNSMLTSCVGSFLLMGLIKIHIRDGFAILSYSSFWAVLFCVLSYMFATMSYCLMMSTFFRRTITATVTTASVWLLMYLPVFMSRKTNHIRYIAAFSPNTAISLAIETILDFEVNGKGFHFSNFFHSAPVNEEMPVGFYILMIYVTSIIFLLIGLIVDFHIKSEFLFFEKLGNNLAKLFVRRRRQRRGAFVRISKDEYRTSKVYQVKPPHKEVSVHLDKVTKIYGDSFVLKDVSMEFYKDDITVLIGHNGAGKSILLNMISGWKGATKGNILLNGLDVKTNFTQARNGLAICCADRLLYNELTVANQLTFFCCLRGLDKKATKMEITKYLEAMELRPYRNTLTGNLSAGLRQSLAVCCALVGNSEIVLLDDPSLSMDSHKRKLMWNLLHSEKQGRTIIMTTQSMVEAATISDQIGIMSGGELSCFGTPYFLHSMYGRGIILRCFKGPHCRSDRVTQAIQKFIPKITSECDCGNELLYHLPSRHDNALSKLFDHLESSAEDLDMHQFTITDVSIENIFYRYGAEIPSGDNHVRYNEIINGISLYEDCDSTYVTKFTPLKGVQRWISNCQALILKLFLQRVHNKTMIIFYFLVPIIFAILSLRLIYINKSEIQPRSLKELLWTVPKVVIESNEHATQDMKAYEHSYRNIAFAWDIKTINVKEHIDHLFSWMPYEYTNQFQMGVSFQSGIIIAWFNIFRTHIPPASLMVVFNAILHAKLNDDAQIYTSFKQLPPVFADATLHPGFMNIGSYISTTIFISFCCVWSYVIMHIVQERNSYFKLMQIIWGVNTMQFWIVSFVYDLLMAMLTAIIVLIIRYYLRVNIFADTSFVSYTLVVVLILMASCLISYNYLFSILFRKEFTAYAFAVSFHIFGSLSFFSLLNTLSYDLKTPITKLLGTVSYSIMSIFPTFSALSVLTKMYNVWQKNLMCERKEIFTMSVIVKKCKLVPNCCGDDETTLKEIADIKADMAALCLCIVFCWILIYLLEWRSIGRTWGFRKYHIPDSTLFNARREHEFRHKLGDESSRFQEKISILTMSPAERKRTSLICENVGKFYGRLIALDSIDLIVNRGEAVAIVGKNGSGKSTLMDILIGNKNMSYGRVLVQGLELKKQPFKVFKNIAATMKCNNSYMFDFTCGQLMYINGLMQGTPRSQIGERCRNWAKMLNFYRYFNMSLQKCSDGVRLRVLFAIAMMSSRSLIYLDLSMRNLDLTGERHFCNIFSKLKEQNTSIVVCTTISRECERFCNRIIRIHNGRVLDSGRPFPSQKKVLKGYLLIVRIRTKETSRFSQTYFLPLANFLENEFKNALLEDYYCNMATFFIPFESTTFSTIYRKLQEKLFQFRIELFFLRHQTKIYDEVQGKYISLDDFNK